MKSSILLLFFLAPIIVYSQNQDNQSLLNAGGKSLTQGNYTNAIDNFTLFLKDHESDTALLLRAQAYLKIGDTCSYCNDLESINNLDPDIFLSNRKNCFKLLKFIVLDASERAMFGVDSILCFVQNYSGKLNYELKYTDDPVGELDRSDTDSENSNLSNCARFSGGEDAMQDFIKNNIQFPERSILNKEFETVQISFFVEKDGTLTNIRADKFSYYSNALEAIRLVKEMPKWKPCVRKLNKVRSGCTVKISFPQPENFQKRVDEIKNKYLATNDTCLLCSMINRKPNKFKSLEDIYSLCYFNKDTIKQTEAFIKKKYPSYHHSIIYQNKYSDDCISLHFDRLNLQLNEVWDFDIPAKYINGDSAMHVYLANNIFYPQEARELGIQGTVYLTFIINEEGRTSNIKILESPDKILSGEASRVIRNMPRWSPALLNDRPTKMKFYLPIKFTLSQ